MVQDSLPFSGKKKKQTLTSAFLNMKTHTLA